LPILAAFEIANFGQLSRLSILVAFEVTSFSSFESCQKWQNIGLLKPAKNGSETYLSYRPVECICSIEK